MADEYRHDPNAVLDYSVDWATWLRSGDTVSSATWIIPSGLTEAPQGHAISGALATVWLQGGTVGETYKVTCRVVTAQGRQEDHTIRLLCRDK